MSSRTFALVAALALGLLEVALFALADAVAGVIHGAAATTAMVLVGVAAIGSLAWWANTRPH